MRIHVTASDLKFGEPGSLKFCPVAWALRRAGHREIRVLPDKIKSGPDQWVYTSKTLINYIRRFDSSVTRSSCKPRSFNIPGLTKLRYKVRAVRDGGQWFVQFFSGFTLPLKNIRWEGWVCKDTDTRAKAIKCARKLMKKCT